MGDVSLPYSARILFDLRTPFGPSTLSILIASLLECLLLGMTMVTCMVVGGDRGVGGGDLQVTVGDTHTIERDPMGRQMILVTVVPSAKETRPVCYRWLDLVLVKPSARLTRAFQL